MSETAAARVSQGVGGTGQTGRGGGGYMGVSDGELKLDEGWMESYKSLK